MNTEFSFKKYIIKSSTKICRVCLTEYIEESKYIFTKTENSTIASMLMLCARVQIACQDGLPDIICAQCLGDLEAANSFRLRCELADSLLRKSRNGTGQGSVRETEKRHVQTSVKEEAFNEEWIDYGLEDNVNSDSFLRSPACELTDLVNHEKSLSQNEFNLSLKTRDNSDTAISNNDFLSTLSDIQSENVCLQDVFNCTECSFSACHQFLLTSHIRHVHCKTQQKYLKCDVCHKTIPNLQYMKIHKMFCSVDVPFMSNFDYFGSIFKMTGKRDKAKQNSCKARRVNIRHTITSRSNTRRSFISQSNTPYSIAPRGNRLGKITSRAITPRANTFNNCRINTPSTNIPSANAPCENTVGAKTCRAKTRCLNTRRANTCRANPLRSYTRSSSHMCEICGKQLSSHEILESHIKRHLNIRDFKCGYCKRCFVDKKDRNLHAKMHTDPKKFECDICGHKTRMKRALIGHLMIHSGEKNFKCQICDYRCINKRALKMHMVSHSDERHYSCPICDAKFKRNSIINKHMWRIHKIIYRVGDYADRRLIK